MNPRVALVTRFWRGVKKSRGCWMWTKGRFANGYGLISADGYNAVRHLRRPLQAHRVSWTLHNGVIPKGMYICHRCDNKLCVRPSHLFIGTSRDNMLDASQKGRIPGNRLRGTQRSNSKLTWRIVKTIRASELTNKALGERYGVAANTISLIRRNKKWRANV